MTLTTCRKSLGLLFGCVFLHGVIFGQSASQSVSSKVTFEVFSNPDFRSTLFHHHAASPISLDDQSWAVWQLKVILQPSHGPRVLLRPRYYDPTTVAEPPWEYQCSVV